MSSLHCKPRCSADHSSIDIEFCIIAFAKHLTLKSKIFWFIMLMVGSQKDDSKINLIGVVQDESLIFILIPVQFDICC